MSCIDFATTQWHLDNLNTQLDSSTTPSTHSMWWFNSDQQNQCKHPFIGTEADKETLHWWNNRNCFQFSSFSINVCLLGSVSQVRIAHSFMPSSEQQCTINHQPPTKKPQHDPNHTTFSTMGPNNQSINVMCGLTFNLVHRFTSCGTDVDLDAFFAIKSISQA